MWDAFKDLIFGIIEFFYNLLGGANGGDWGMAIIIVTVIFRLLISPLMHKQTKSSFQMQKVQPLMNEIKTKFADDPVRQQEEMQKLYAEAKFNPLAGCLPMLLQMPIFIALFQVLSEMGNRTHGSTYEFYSLVPSLVMTPSQAFTDSIATFIPYVILMIIFAGATFLPMVLQQRNNEGAQKKQMIIMGGVMSIFMLWISWNSPAGVLLFWGTSSLLGVAQQQVSMGIMKRRDAEAASVVEIKPIEVDVTRKVKKNRPTKKSK